MFVAFSYETEGERNVGHDDNRFSRRQIMGGLGVGLAATVVRPTFAENIPRIAWPTSRGAGTVQDFAPPMIFGSHDGQSENHFDRQN